MPDLPLPSGGVRHLVFWPLLLLLPLLCLNDERPHEAQTEYDHARRLFQSGYLAISQQEAESGFRRFQALDPIWAVRFQVLEAKSMLYRGMYDNAISILSTFPDRDVSDESVEKLAIETVALSRQQQSDLASRRLAQAETLCAIRAFTSCGDVLAAHALLDLKSERILEARRCFLQALLFARSHQDKSLEASTLSNLGYIALQVDHYDEALDWLKSAYESSVKINNENYAQIIAGNVGWTFYELGDDERALEQFLSAQKAASRLGNLRFELKWLNTAGYVYRDSGDWPRAESSYRKALDIARQINSREDILKALEDLADVSVFLGKLDNTDSYISQATSIVSSSHPNAVLLLTEGKLAAARGQYAQAEKYLRSVLDDPACLTTIKLNADYELAILYELQHNAVAAERMYRVTVAAYDAARSQLKNEESQLPFGANAAQIYDSYIHLLVQQGRSDTALAVADESRARTLEQAFDREGVSKMTHTKTIDPRRISAALNSTLLFYWLGENQSYLWAITPAKVALFPLPPRRQIAARIESYRKTLLDLRDPLQTRDADGQALYQMLVAPAATMIRPTEPVIILDDGALSKLNFETLLAGSNSRQTDDSSTQLHYLIDDLTLSSAPSLAMLAPAKMPSGSARQMLLIGNPVSPDRDFPSLPMFSFEMSRVGSHFASKQVLGGSQATPAAYVASRPDQYSYIHFVSHAVASSTTPLDSAIILSDSAGQENSYKLYAREIIQHPLHAKLVTISACYGSGTRAYAGEGLVGLSWAFLRAGAHQVIGALWEVSDDSTPLLMDRLYQGLEGGQSPVLALHSAKLELLHAQTRFSAPFYWAPFQIYGRQ